VGPADNSRRAGGSANGARGARQEPRCDRRNTDRLYTIQNSSTLAQFQGKLEKLDRNMRTYKELSAKFFSGNRAQFGGARKGFWIIEGELDCRRGSVVPRRAEPN
jgi:hypothetical protein